MQAKAQSIAESGDTGGTTYFVHDPTGMSQQQNPDGSWLWTAKDGLGSMRSMVDNAATPLESQQYSPCGEQTDSSGIAQTPFGYTGEPTDSNGLVYLRERYYNPQTGTFISPDPVEGSMRDPMSLNRYSYVQNNPINRTDPSGRMPVSPSFSQSLNNMMTSDPLAFANMVNSGGLCNFLQTCPPFCPPGPTSTIPPTNTPSPTPYNCLPTPTITPTPLGTPFPSATPRPFNTGLIQSLSNADLDLISLDVYYEAQGQRNQWQAIANVWFNRLADPYATTTSVERLLADNSALWPSFVSGFYNGPKQLDPLNLTAADIQILKDNYPGGYDSATRSAVDAAKSHYPDPQYAGMLAFFHAKQIDVPELVCEMQCIAAAPGLDVAANLAKRGPLQVAVVCDSQTLIMNNGIFLPGPGDSPYCKTYCGKQNPR